MARVYLGTAKIFREDDGSVVYDERDLKRVAGDEDGDIEGEDEGDIEGDDEIEVGRRNKKHKNKDTDDERGRRDNRQGRRRDKDDAPARPAAPSGGGSAMGKPGYGFYTEPGMITGAQTLGAAGSFNIQRVAQSEFDITDLSFAGSHASTLIQKIKIGDDVLFDDSVGVSIELFSPTSQLRKIFVGKVIPQGLTVEVSGTLSAAGDAKFAFIGTKKKMGKVCHA